MNFKDFTNLSQELFSFLEQMSFHKESQEETKSDFLDMITHSIHFVSNTRPNITVKISFIEYLNTQEVAINCVISRKDQVGIISLVQYAQEKHATLFQSPSSASDQEKALINNLSLFTRILQTDLLKTLEGTEWTATVIDFY